MAPCRPYHQTRKQKNHVGPKRLSSVQKSETVRLFPIKTNNTRALNILNDSSVRLRARSHHEFPVNGSSIVFVAYPVVVIIIIRAFSRWSQQSTNPRSFHNYDLTTSTRLPPVGPIIFAECSGNLFIPVISTPQKCPFV